MPIPNLAVCTQLGTVCAAAMSLHVFALHMDPVHPFVEAGTVTQPGDPTLLDVPEELDDDAPDEEADDAVDPDESFDDDRLESAASGPPPGSLGVL
jgi:hypothetical protein